MIKSKTFVRLDNILFDLNALLAFNIKETGAELIFNNNIVISINLNEARNFRSYLDKNGYK